ncbi:TauD/TfdA family dioxygenase [Nocardia sp. NPDC046763]|uniref:TauD/TfdA family dioxygenase n=1 Tax=Nocardia sp. NPDC046763 TaxID=3155256 RepID=UPI0033F9C015
MQNLLDYLRSELEQNGYCHLANLPAGFDHLGILAGLGPIRPQYRGELVWDLKPEPNMDDVYHSNNRAALLPHTEGYELSGLPPRYIGLWCVRPAAGPGGETTLADGHSVLSVLSDSDLTLLRTHQYEWKSSEGLARQGIRLRTRHPVLEDHGGNTVLRFSYNNAVRVEEGPLIRYLELGLEHFDRTRVALRLARADLLVWDNWRMLHSRTAFRDPGRHLKRVLIDAKEVAE